jgi:hypothetical protein
MSVIDRLMIVAAAVCLIAWAAAEADAQQSELFDGTLAGWTIENSDGANFTVRDGVLRVEGPNGWLRSARQFGDVSLALEFRFVTPDADSGLFLRAAEGGGTFARGWPNRAYQVQIRNPVTESRFPPVGGLFRHGMPTGDLTFDPAVVDKVVRPTGEWQTLEVDVLGEQLTVRLNGTEVMRAGGIANPRGFVGLQGEVGAIEVRALRVRER